MSKFVDIPVKCISEECKNCEDLEIEVNVLKDVDFHMNLLKITIK